MRSAAMFFALSLYVFCGLAPAYAEKPARADHQKESSPASFAGKWQTTFGEMTLTQTGADVKGSYGVSGFAGAIKGKLAGRKLTFEYTEPGVKGEGWFEVAEDGKTFSGKWRRAGETAWQNWDGTRGGGGGEDNAIAAEMEKGFAGLWQTTYGRMRLRQAGDKVEGTYSFNGNATIVGTVKDQTFTFKYSQPDGETGEGTFKLSDDEKEFSGNWTTDRQNRGGGEGADLRWSGHRITGEKGKIWLVVLEAPWEHDLAENEYSYGLMLRTFFARVPSVQVRHRMLNSETDLRRYCGELAYLAEPVVLYISSHGSRDGLTVGGKTVGPDALADCLKARGDIRLLHFGSCLVCAGDVPAKLHKALGPSAKFPISGFTEVADWAGSAVIDFTYLDLIFSRGLSPAKAAEQTRKMMTFANGTTKPGDAIAPAGLVVIEPKGE